MSNFENSFNDWELEIQRYGSEQEIPLPDNVKSGVIFSNVKGYIYKHLVFNTDVNTPYTRNKDIVINYFNSGRVVRYVQSCSKGSPVYSGPAPMELDAIWRSLRKGGKKGDYKGKYRGDYRIKGKEFYNKGLKGKSDPYRGKGKCKGKQRT